MKKMVNLKGETVKVSVVEERQRKAAAYHNGSCGADYTPLFDFEQEYYNKGKIDNARIHEEIANGDR